MRLSPVACRPYVAARLPVALLVLLIACKSTETNTEESTSETPAFGSDHERVSAPVERGAQQTICSEPGQQCESVRIAPEESGDLTDGAALVEGDDWSNNPTGESGVTLARETVFPPYLWVANHTNNTVSRVNTVTGVEEGRYWVGHNPSRTAVDLDGNVWIGGRNDGRLTKVLWDVTQCPDRDEDGVVRTASAEVLGPLNSLPDPHADECVVYSEVPDPAFSSIRGIAAGPDGRVWFGYTNGGVKSIDPHSFDLGPHVLPTNIPLFQRDDEGVFRPIVDGAGEPLRAHGSGVYGLVVDREGFLYISTMQRNSLQRFSTYTGEWDAYYADTGCYNYGIAVDGRDRIWLGCTGSGGVLMFDPSRRTTHHFGVPVDLAVTDRAVTVPVVLNRAAASDPSNSVTGLGAEPATGDIWVSFYSRGHTGRLRLSEGDMSDSTWTIIPTAPGNDLRGVGFDYQGFAWTHGVSRDLIWKIDPETNTLAAGYEHGVSVGGGGHYTYSDFTGSTGLSFTAPRGLWRLQAEAPRTDRPLTAVRLHGFVPSDALVEIRLRALDETGAALSEWIPGQTDVGAAVFYQYETGSNQPSFDLQELDLRAHGFEVEVRLSTTGQVRPIVNAIELIWEASTS